MNTNIPEHNKYVDLNNERERGRQEAHITRLRCRCAKLANPDCPTHGLPKSTAVHGLSKTGELTEPYVFDGPTPPPAVTDRCREALREIHDRLFWRVSGGDKNGYHHLHDREIKAIQKAAARGLA